MREKLEPCDITITDQADIESGRLSSCPGHALLHVAIRNATNVLNFTGLTKAWVIDVAHSPLLEALHFPQLENLESLIVDGAEALTGIFLGRLASLPPKIYDNGDYTLGSMSTIYITDSPSLFELDLRSATGLHFLILENNPSMTWSNPNITSIVTFESNVCASLSSLRSVKDLHLIGRNTATCHVLSDLTSVYNFTLTGIYPKEIVFGQNALSVIDTLTVESSVLDSSASWYYSSTLELGPIASVGRDALITSNGNVHIDLHNLESIRGNLSVNSNQNCTFNFDHLNEVGNLVLMDNPDTALPSFPSLARANSIHLRGHIDQSNIFPALIRVSGTVTIEAWNDDFDCSKLISQHQEDIIYNLVCNGTNNETQTTSGKLPLLDITLSQGAKIGIGIGVVFGVLGAAVAIVWLILRFRLQLRALSQNGSTSSPVRNEEATGLLAPESPETIPEELDDPTNQGQFPTVGLLTDIGDDSMNEAYELPCLPSELPANPPSRTNRDRDADSAKRPSGNKFALGAK